MKLKHWLKWKFRPPLIICLSGKARHGKDSFGLSLKTKLENEFGLKVQRLSVGDVLKNMTDFHDRDFLQLLGTVLRATEGKEYLIKQSTKGYNGADVVIYTDTRYPIEISYFENAGMNTMTFRVTRITDNGIYESNLTDKQKAHPSETALDDYKFDFYIQAKDIKDLIQAAWDVSPLCFDAWRRGFKVEQADSYYWYA